MQSHKKLVLYKRHTTTCTVNTDPKIRVPVSVRRFWFECDCPIWIVGRTPSGDILPRQATGFSNLAQAEALRTSLIAEYQEDGAAGQSLAACIRKYLESRQHELSDKTYAQTKLLLERLRLFCDEKGVHNIREMNVDLLESFKVSRSLIGLANTSRATSVAKLRCFLRVAFRRGWIAQPLVDKVTAQKAVYEQKEPFTDEEVNLILAEALKLKGGTHGYAKQPQTLRLLLEVMLETGMRVGDAIQFDPKVLAKGERLWVYTYDMQKQKQTEKPRTIEAFISGKLKKAIDECQWLSPDRPFAFGHSKNPNYLANEVYERMQTIGSRCGVADCRPHRLRDTFAVRKLLGGVQLDDVSRLLGHSSVRITELYYARWTAGRKKRLERLVAETLVDPDGNGLGD